MKILHLSTSTIGGAGVVANHIAQMQIEDGHEALVYTIGKTETPNAVFVKRSLIKQFITRLNTIVSLVQTNPKWGQLTSTSVSAGILRSIEEFSPEVIHIHNWFNLLNFNDIEILLKTYPCVFHIHDSRLMTGGCHYTLDCSNYLNGCIKCSATTLKRKLVTNSYTTFQEIFSKNKTYGLVFPSLWLQRDFETSNISKNATVIRRVRNPVNYKQIKELDLPKKQIISCVISDLNAEVKGFDTLLGAIELLRRDGNGIQVRVVGGNPTKKQVLIAESLNIELLGRLSNRQTLSVISESMLLVVPSFSENSPTVVIEAQALGTCVLVTNIKGCRELVVDGKSGFICEPTIDSLASGINRVFSAKNLAEVATFTKKETTGDLLKLREVITSTYNTIISAHREGLESG
jgi:glycosyltransferase involved in cell wall biosynthesis